MFWFFTLAGLTAANGLALFVPGIREALNAFFKAVILTLLVIMVGAWYLVNQGINHVQCANGDQAACYADSYANETLETHSQAFIARTNPPADMQTMSYMKRFSILRTEWYDGRVVKTRMLCVWTGYPIPTESENCLPRTVITGPDAGRALPFPSDDAADPTSISHRQYITQVVKDEWLHTTW